MNIYNEKHQTTFDTGITGSFTEENLLSKDIRIISRQGNNVKMLFNNKAYDAVIKEFNPETKYALINVSGYNFRINISEPLDKLIHELGFLKAGKHSVKEIKSPMPGLVVNLYVMEGDNVYEGDKLLSLEAMKMENIIKSPGEGIIKTITVTKGQSVEKNQILIEFA